MSKSLTPHSAVSTIAEIPGKGIVLAAGDSVPSDTASGYSPGCLFIQTDGSTINTVLYANIGTYASCNFDPLTG